MENIQQIETVCKICGLRLVLECDNFKPGPQRDAVDACIKKWSGMAVHSLCYDRYDYMESKKEYDKVLAGRNQEWNLMCPPYFQNFEETKHPNIRSHQKVMNSRGKSIMIVGDPGKGKTMSMWQWIKREYMEGKFVYASTHADFSSDVIKMIQKGNASAPRWIKMISNADIFALDDLGKGKMKTSDGSSSQAESLLFQIIDSRYRNNRICIFTTQWRGDDLANAMNEDKGEATLRRIREMCHGGAIQF